MADFAKLSMKGLYSKSSDYSDPVTTFRPSAYEPATANVDEYFHVEVLANLSGDSPGHTTIDTSIIGAASLLVIKNNDTTNYVTATFDCAGMSTTDTSVRIHAGGFFVTTDFTTAEELKLVSNTGRCECEIFIVGT
tara:strand:- start:116 stop:523 length:408 start_codon:yes stop_codon:yes gene_type:complete